jgi:hypothetical protein
MQGLVLAMVLAMALTATAAPAFVLAADPVVSGPEQVTGPARASEINAYLLLGVTRERLAQLYPDLSPTELDKLVFKIADINSMRTLPR